jgi:signal transduction histidine kinase
VRSLTLTGRRLSAAGPRSRLLVDGALAVVVFVGSAALLSHGLITRPGAGGLGLLGLALVACATVPLMAWRRIPLGVFAVTGAASVVLAGLGDPVELVLGPIVALYLLAASREQQTPWTRRMTAIVVGLFVAFLGAAAAAQGAFPVNELFHTGLAWAVAWFAGERTRLRREHIADLRKRALRAEHDAERERLLAAAEERARIARDLHDSAGHAISVIAVRAGAARLWHHKDPDRSVRALEAIEELARQTVEEIDHIVGALREGPADDVIEAPAGLASLDTLIARYTAAGLEVSLDVAGKPRSVSGAVDQAAYRILQEALTNAARHGAGSARVELAFDDAAVELTVTNPVRVDGARRSGEGHGLVGMRERATLLDGSLHAERVNGSFRVHTRIPTGGRGL